MVEPTSSGDSILRLPLADARSVLTVLDGRPAIVLDSWRHVDEGEALASSKGGGSELGVIVPRERVAQAQSLGLRVGLSVAGDSDFEVLAEALAAPALAGIELIAIEVPKFTDGRHYSLARLLRERAGYRGALRVFGDVVPDQLFYMRRCGYTSFELKAGKSLETGLRTLQAFSVTYQGAVDDPRPLYRRRA